MEVLICKGCGKMFKSAYGEEYCDECQALPDTDFKRVREYLWMHPNTPAEIVSRECNVPLQEVMHFVRQDRLEVSQDSPILLRCENCGKQILSGTYCKECSEKMSQRARKLNAEHEKKALSGTVGKPQQGDDGRMRYL